MSTRFKVANRKTDKQKQNVPQANFFNIKNIIILEL
jgi:hypothetical protein